MENKIEGNAIKRLQWVRNEVAHTALKKTGHNTFSKYDYFQLQDFMPQATEAFFKAGLAPVFSITRSPGMLEGTIDETASLVIYNVDDRTDYVSFVTPTAEATNSNNPIQNLGSKQTYLRRYLYMMALDLSETDIIDASAGGPEDAAKKTQQAKPAQRKPSITPQQIEKLTGLYTPQELTTMSAKLNHKDVSEWDALEARKAIEFKEKENA